jgi:hypothetical protein
MRDVSVEVFWEGRYASKPPSVLKHAQVSRFPQNRDLWPNNQWSIVLEFAVPPSVQGNPSNATAHFLVDTAPHERLFSGNTFELFAGRDRLATVNIP